MSEIWQILVQFLLRLTIGVALAMAFTSPKLVTAGFFRVHLWVLMGMNTFAVVAILLGQDAYIDGPIDYRVLVGLAAATAGVCYLGSVVWLYENERLGQPMLQLVAALALLAAMSSLVASSPQGFDRWTLAWAALDVISGGLLLGMIVTAMLLGHWYLNNPSMQLLPLKRLLLLMGSAIVTRALLCLTTLLLSLSQVGLPGTSWWLFLGLRWAAGLIGVLVLAVMAWRTLAIPNTQSATGILYAAVILAFIGELTSALLSTQTPFVV